MSRGPLRRAIVFVDFSALRATLNRDLHVPGARRVDPNQDIDFERLGRHLCGPRREFIRIVLYTGTPVPVAGGGEGGDAVWLLGNMPVHDHEAYRARGVVRNFDDLQANVRTRSRYTRLATGRVLARRVELRHGPAFEWAQAVLAGCGEEGMSEDDRAFFDTAARVNQEAKEAREELCRRLVALKDQGRIPRELMSSYSTRLAELLGEQIDFTEKGVDTRLTVEVLEACMHDACDDVVLFAADEDYVPLVDAVKRTGRHVIHAFWDVPNHGRILRAACDDRVDVGKSDLAGFLFG